MHLFLRNVLGIHGALLIVAMVVRINAAVAARMTATQPDTASGAAYVPCEREIGVILELLDDLRNLSFADKLYLDKLLGRNHRLVLTLDFFARERIEDDARIELIGKNLVNLLRIDFAASQRRETPLVCELCQLDVATHFLLKTGTEKRLNYREALWVWVIGFRLFHAAPLELLAGIAKRRLPGIDTLIYLLAHTIRALLLPDSVLIVR
ncbi:MAG: hypothetical protein WDN10_00245 [bacterium]